MKETNKLGRLDKLSRKVLIDTSKMLKDAKTELFDGIHGRVLEVGAGIGVNVYFLNRPEVEHWVAVEPDRKLVEECHKMVAEMEDRVTVFQGYLHELEEPPESFDYVVFTTLLCSVPDPHKIVAEAHRMLKPGGKLCIIEHIGDKFGFRSAFQMLFKYPWKFATGCNCRNKPIPALSQPGFWEGIDGEIDFKPAPLRVKRFSPLLELTKPFVMTELTKKS